MEDWIKISIFLEYFFLFITLVVDKSKLIKIYFVSYGVAMEDLHRTIYSSTFVRSSLLDHISETCS
jgi:hypothetical protein